MNLYTRLITLVGGILVLFSFAFPWADDYTGVQLANDTSDISNVGFVLLIFAASMLIIVSSIGSKVISKVIVETFYKLLTLISGVVGLICFVVLFFAERLEIDAYSRSIDEIHYGAFLSAIGFIIAMFGVTISSKKED